MSVCIVFFELVAALTIIAVEGEALTPSTTPTPPTQHHFDKQLVPSLAESSLLDLSNPSTSEKLSCCKGAAEVCRYWAQSLFDGPVKGTIECMSLGQQKAKVCVKNSADSCCITGATGFGPNLHKMCFQRVQGTWCNAQCKTPTPTPVCPSPSCPIPSQCVDPTPCSTFDLPPGCCQNKAEICKIKNGQRRCIARLGTSKDGPPCFKITGSGRKKKCCLTGGAKKPFPAKNCYRASRRRECIAHCV